MCSVVFAIQAPMRRMYMCTHFPKPYTCTQYIGSVNSLITIDVAAAPHVVHRGARHHYDVTCTSTSDIRRPVHEPEHARVVAKAADVERPVERAVDHLRPVLDQGQQLGRVHHDLQRRLEAHALYRVSETQARSSSANSVLGLHLNYLYANIAKVVLTVLVIN